MESLMPLNYFKTARFPEQGNEFLSAFTSFDDFWAEVRTQSLLIQTPRPVVCGATVVKEKNDFTLVSPANSEPTLLDVVLSVTQNIKIAVSQRTQQHLLCSED
jgi:hypothetical protein